MKNSSLSIIAVFVGSTFLLVTTGCDADNSSDSMHDEEQHEALDNDETMHDVAIPGAAVPGAAMPGAAMPGVGMPGVGMPGVGMPDVGMPDHSETSDDAHMHSDDHSATPDTQQPSDARKVTIEATDFAFDPATINAQPGEKLYIELVNKGEAVHMWQIEVLPATHVHAAVGETSRKVVQAPSEPGSYRIVCMTPGHEERGMVGWLKVRKNADAE